MRLQHVEEIYPGDPFNFEGLISDKHGSYDLPVWAQPFEKWCCAAWAAGKLGF